MQRVIEESLMSSSTDRRRIKEAADYFKTNRHLFESFAQSLMAYFENNPKLKEFIHFIKYRIKDEGSLRTKLERRLAAANDRNLADGITDFAGLRIIHLHMDQLMAMHPLVLDILKEQNCELLESPKAYCWDLEYEDLFRQMGVETIQRDSMYMTVHYDIVANQRKKITCELQVRSLMEELWGEVSHRINYPNESPSVTCQDQLKVLARLTSGCGRLVDSIFKTHRETVER